MIINVFGVGSYTDTEDPFTVPYNPDSKMPTPCDNI